MKFCRGCEQEHPLSEFALIRKGGTGRQSRCKMCRKEYERQRRWQQQLKRYAYLRDHPCSTCGEADPLVLDFDHGDASLKKGNVSQLAFTHGWDDPRTQAEVAKCDVLCRNCHHRMTILRHAFERYPEQHARISWLVQSWALGRHEAPMTT